MKPLTLGIAGTAKNTGKTTTTSELIKVIYKKDLKLGLTSIGYDGEEIDNVTKLPKPRLIIKPGTVVAIAEKCLYASSAEFDILSNTSIKTSLGNIIIGKVVKEGLVVIAGPNKSSDLKKIITILTDLGTDINIIDGALNRIVPMIETDGIVLATGAAKNSNINELVNETNHITEIMNSKQEKFNINDNKILLITNEELKIQVNCSSLVSFNTVDRIIKKAYKKKPKTLYIPGLVGIDFLNYLLIENNSIFKNTKVILSNPINLMVSGKHDRIINLYKQLISLNIDLKYKKIVPILAITINPFYPQYRYSSSEYKPSFVDKYVLKDKFISKIKTPVFNMVEDDNEELFTLLTKRIIN